MLGDEECRARTVHANELMARPETDSSRMADRRSPLPRLYGTHLGVVATKKFAGLDEALTNGKVLSGQSLKLLRQVRPLHHQILRSVAQSS